MSIERHETGPRMSQAVVHGGTVYLAGQVATDPVPSVGEQTRQILAKIDGLLAACGSAGSPPTSTDGAQAVICSTVASASRAPWPVQPSAPRDRAAS